MDCVTNEVSFHYRANAGGSLFSKPLSILCSHTPASYSMAEASHVSMPFSRLNSYHHERPWQAVSARYD